MLGYGNGEGKKREWCVPVDDDIGGSHGVGDIRDTMEIKKYWRTRESFLYRYTYLETS